jgi:hypothetical protein
VSESVELASSAETGGAQITWPGALLALLVSHVVGDVLLQTDRQAAHKTKGAGDALARRALAGHVATYTLAFVPALAWIGRDRGLRRALSVCGLVAGPHLLIDDGRLVQAWLRGVKGARGPAPALVIAVDQSFHVLSLTGAALVAAR